MMRGFSGTVGGPLGGRAALGRAAACSHTCSGRGLSRQGPGQTPRHRNEQQHFLSQEKLASAE